jgi:hypothetical protein
MGNGVRFLGIMVIVATIVSLLPSGAAMAASQEVYGGGCYFAWNGSEYTGKRCPQSDGSEYVYQPDGRGGWDYFAQCADTGAFQACLFASGIYVEAYGDGSKYAEDRSRTYVIYHTDGSLAEAGSYDANGVQRASQGRSTLKNSGAMRNRSWLYWWYQGWAVQTVVNSNPGAFAGLITMTQASNDYAVCLWNNDSATDFDHDRRTGFNELAEHCTGWAFG